MRRVAVQNAQIGMILARGVYDGSGTLILDAGTVLDAIHLPVLPRLEVREVIVQDARVDDVLIVPLISEETEATAIRLLHRLIDSNRGILLEHMKLDISSVDRVVKEIIQNFYTVFMGEINIEGSLSMGNYDYVHPVKVAGLSMLIGQKAGFSRADLTSLGISALLHNIGYINVPQGLLTNLDPEAQSQSPDFRKHVDNGANILRYQKDLDPRIAEAVLHHHERWSGGGYNLGLKGDKISQFARIIAIASTYHSLISKRRNQEPYSPPEAAEYISAYSGELFDPKFVQVFISNVPFYPKGVSVKLNTGEIGIVTDSNVGYIGRTKVRICYSRNSLELPNPYDVDLSLAENQNLLISEILDY
jgi:HD-GYP domain-containing protein (c-di-GMP phosphodiesterase class II)